MVLTGSRVLYVTPPAGGSDECKATVGRPPDRLPRLGNHWVNIVMDNAFPCAGWITSVDYFRAVEEGTVYFGVWRAVGELEFVLKYKLPLAPTSVAKHRVFAPTPFEVQRGDLIGVHYPENAPYNRRDPRLRSAIIPHAEPGDPGVTNAELYSTYNAEVFNERLRVGDAINLKDRFNGRVLRRTFALRANVVYENPGTDSLHNHPASLRTRNVTSSKTRHVMQAGHSGCVNAVIGLFIEWLKPTFRPGSWTKAPPPPEEEPACGTDVDYPRISSTNVSLSESFPPPPQKKRKRKNELTNSHLIHLPNTLSSTPRHLTICWKRRLGQNKTPKQKF